MISINWELQVPPPPSSGQPQTVGPQPTQQPLSGTSPSTTSPTTSSDGLFDLMTAEVAAAHHTNGASNGSSTNASTSINQQQYSVEYLSQLLKDKKQLAAFPNVFHHLERLADEEISKVRIALFNFEFAKDQVKLPEPEGEVTITTEKVFVPAKEYPDYNFVGRILGPRGMTAKQLEQETGCKIMVRGRGSMRDKKKEELNRGKPNWEHLSEELHVLIQCEDTPNRARVKLMRAVEEVKKLLVPAPEGEDELKRKQLMELAIINGTYRSGNDQSALAAAQLAAAKQPLAAALLAEAAALQQAQARGVLLAANPGLARSPTMAVAGAPIVMSPGRGATSTASATSAASQLTAAHQMFTLQSQLQSQNNVAAAQAVAAQQALFQQQQHQQAAAAAQMQSAEYQQLLMSQGISLDGLTCAAAMQYPQAYQQAALLNGTAVASVASAGQYADYAGVDLATAVSQAGAPGAILNTRRVLGTARDHPYKQ
ncbi:hypothetical protein WR25_17238 [Diploscapter pachys]|uniref:K Homology domain-containing protein n=1 Tax=Diploscapter pachys TaxID=2018661 RepID=A0A2A2LW28_9BILA|nr:hypothetical protein WR25_17238 [Diploscapter pachys]